MINLRNTKRNYEVSYPTKFSELDFNKLLDVVKNVNISEHYAIIALSQSFTPFSLATLGAKQNKDMAVPVTANFIRANDPNNKLHATEGDKVIISRSDLELSTHLPVRFGLSTATIADILQDDTKTRTMLHQNPVDEEGNLVKEIIIVEFKLVPISAIKATFDRNITITDAYRTVISGS